MPCTVRPLTLTLAIAASSAAVVLTGDTLAAQAPAAAAGHRMPAPAMRDSTEAFLRVMVSHHEGLIVMSDSARAKATRAGTKADARKLHTEQARERRQMQAMLRRMAGDTAQPTLLPSNQAYLDTLGRTEAGPAYDRTFYRLAVAHHREGVTMIDRQLPHLTAEARRMATRMRAMQQKEIAEYERKMRAI